LLGLRSGINACHHPASESPLVNKASTNKFDDGRQNEKQMYKFALRNQDSEWSSMFEIPETGPAEGIIRVLSSRWPIVTRKNSTLSQKRREVSLDPDVFELCYSVTELPGEWGEFSRIVKITPRFFVKNNSSSVAFEMKQAGVLDSASLKLYPGEISPFYWKDFRLPALVCIRPIDRIINSYRWSGAFDICTMGTFPLRIRPRDGWEADQSVLSIKAMIEIRSVSSGVNISLLEEDVEFVGGMFRVENNSPFPIWMAQDGVLSNPILAQDVNVTKISSESYPLSQYQKKNLSLKPPEIDGDVVLPGGKKLFALDVPFRQGKYAHRRAATFEELLRVRIGLAPLSSRSGIETAKVISFTSIGDSIRLNPTKLDCLMDFKNAISGIRILGIVVTYGPTRVLRFELMEKVSSRGDVMGSVASHGVYTPSLHPRFVVNSKEVNDKRQEFLHEITIKSAVEASLLKSNGKVPKENEVRRGAFFHEGKIDLNAKDIENDIIFTFQGSFSAILFSLVDSAPSEIATVSIKGLEAVAKWNLNRTKDATSFVSIAWIQVDNHIPSAPYPVALCPDRSERGHQSKDHETTPLLAMAFKFAPKHHSGFLCLRHVTIAPSNLAIAVDLAFVIRLQGLLLSIRQHFSRDDHARSNSECIPLPEFVSIMDRETEFGSNSFKLYFEGLTILPSNINFSVAPARGLNAAQAQLEGSEAAAIHTAVRKGDIRLIDGGVVGVSIGKKNQTVIAVLKGMFKSILVDALLRLDGASLYFSGVSLRNHESSGQNLKAFLVAHYLTSLRENMPSLLGSLAAFGNPLGLIKGIGDGVSDFVSEPVKGLKRSVKELDPIHVVDGVARGTESLARHTVGGIADSASMLTETFSKNMAVLTLDRNYAQRRDIARGSQNEDFKFVEGIESGVAQLVRGVIEGVTGVVHAPLRGAEKRGLEGFAKGIGKGLLGLLVKPVIGLSDAATDVMIGVKGSVDGGRQSISGVQRMPQLRPRRTMYGKDRILRLYSLADAAAASLMLRTRLAGENYVSHLDMGDKVLLISDKKFVLLGMDGQEILLVKLKFVTDVSLEQMESLKLKQTQEWGVVIRLKVHGYDKTQVEILSCGTSLNLAHSLLDQLKRALSITSNL
jgi:Vacuolar-sorting-associated 13 protein C-terminal/SHR-binding domain of vacuolar-sorting associated protein 13/Autophagy-related protein C terminal domain